MTADALLSVLVGALGASLLGLLGAWIQSRREHVRWVREQRFAAYNGLMKLAERVRSRDPSDAAEDAEYLENLFRALGTLRLVGPGAVLEAARTFGEAASAYEQLPASDDPETEARRAELVGRISTARKALVELMRKELGMAD